MFILLSKCHSWLTPFSPSLLPPGYGKNRKGILSYVKNPRTGKFEYVPGLVETP